MKFKTHKNRSTKRPSGFALISSILVMSLLMLVALAMLSISSVSTRSAYSSQAQLEANANARLALMIAIGELQKEMGPDMRVSAESALFDTDTDTAEIDGLEQSHWMASYNAWGGWLNNEYEIIDDHGSPLSLDISDTYVDRRSPMFRRWLVSLPDDQIQDINAPFTALSSDNSIVVVGEGSLGKQADTEQHKITRAYLKKADKNGRYAWWIGPENHKAKINTFKDAVVASASSLETSQGTSSEVGVSSLEGFDGVITNENISEKLITLQSLRPAMVASETVNNHFYDLTAHGKGLMTSTRTGALKKDLSLLLDGDNLPSSYKFKLNDIREPSIRPMSQDLAGKNPTRPGRHFASWTRLRHFYRMYRKNSDATNEGTQGGGNLKWDNYKPYTNVVSSKYRDSWKGSNTYARLPIMAKLTFIYSLQSIAVPDSNPKKYNCYLVYTPVYTFWNPYNVELRMNNRDLGALSLPYKILPLGFYRYLNGVPNGGLNPVSIDLKSDYGSFFSDDSSSQIVFKPGELRMFSYRSNGNGTGKQTLFLPGFDPQAIGGDKMLIHKNVSSTQKPGIALTFANPANQSGNVWFGNTPGALNTPFFFGGYGSWLPTMYAHDWFQKDQVNTPINPKGSTEIGKWQFADNDPLPFAFNQFAVKTSSELEYESIDWEQDWRSKNWLQAPPYYFGSAQYISQDKKTAHTQRLDNPYTMHFGAMSGADMPKVVPHLGDNAFLGSGSSPHEKVTAAVMLELPTAPISSIAGFSNMRTNPGWTHQNQIAVGGGGAWSSFSGAVMKEMNYQSGVTGGGLGNSFIHPMLPRTDVYRYVDNSKSQDVSSWSNNTTERDNKVYNDYWDHTFLLNDALWDDYYVSSLADQVRTGADAALSLDENIDQMFSKGKVGANNRLHFIRNEGVAETIKAELKAQDGYLKSAKYLMVEGMFNVNSTSVDAWYALFTGIRSRELVYRDNGELKKIKVPSDSKIALSRFNTEISEQEMGSPEHGVTLTDDTISWTGVRYLTDEQLLKLAEECVKQVKLRGPFLNYSEFINRRLSDDKLGTMGALQSAIDYDDKSPDSKSINYKFKNGPDYMITNKQLGDHDYKTPEAAVGSRFTAIPGYIIQSDLLKPIGNTLTVRDDTFRIRAYGESLDANGKVVARAWCEAIVQRYPDYCDPANDASVPARLIDKNGLFKDNAELTELNRRFGRRFRIQSFHWLSPNEV